ncbi:MAG: DUF885 family protein [Lachnospiraceae bacterium]|nr:DUF885 family protein [Lachnospiraceae bacterium]
MSIISYKREIFASSRHICYTDEVLFLEVQWEDYNLKQKLLSLLLCLVLTTTLIYGCRQDNSNINSKPETTTETTTSGNISTDDDNYPVQEAFNEFLDDCFESLITSSTFTFRLRLHDPDSFGLSAPEVCIDTFSDTYFTDTMNESTILKDTLAGFEYASLTSEQQLIYDILEDIVECDLLLCKNYIYYEPLTTMSGIQNQLPVLFSELPLTDEETIIECINLLNTIPDYFQTIINFENEKGKAGCFMSENAYNDIVKQCNTLASPSGYGFLQKHFENTVNSLDCLDDTKKASYVSQLKDAVADNFMEGYTYLTDELDIISTRYGHNNEGLSLNDKSISYYEALVKSYTGSSKTIEELISAVDKALENDIYNMQVILLSNPDISDSMENYTLPYEDDPNAALNYLKEEITETFPKAPVDSFTVENVDKALEDFLSPAFYLIPAIDDMNTNIIFINNSSSYGDMDLFPTLAHEGFPGHLYQTTYFAATNPHPIRHLLNLGGYVEGWAKYVELYSYSLCNLDENLASLLALNQSYSFALYSRIDMGIHYEGWGLQDVKKFLLDYGITDSATSLSIYNTLLDNPGIYLQYYIGYLEICQLRDYAKSALGDNFSLLGFHAFILNAGPCQFDILRDKMDVWIEKQTDN